MDDLLLNGLHSAALCTVQGGQTVETYDPVALTNEELAGDGPLSAWQRDLLQSSSATASVPDLSGGLLVQNHVKYAQVSVFFPS